MNFGVKLGLGCAAVVGLLMVVGFVQSEKDRRKREEQLDAMISRGSGAPPQTSSLVRLGSRGDIVHLLARPGLAEDMPALERDARAYCDLHLRPGGYCNLIIWGSREHAPMTSNPTQEQLDAAVAGYIRNPAAGYDCFERWGATHSYRSTSCPPEQPLRP